MHNIAPSIVGLSCQSCRKPASHKIEEVDLVKQPIVGHPFTNYLCCECFGKVMGYAAIDLCKLRAREEGRQ